MYAVEEKGYIEQMIFVFPAWKMIVDILFFAFDRWAAKPEYISDGEHRIR